MVALNSSDSKMRKTFPKPRMLKDYLLDDLSSCSSNGFRSYPRRQSCTTVRFLLEIDLKTRDSNHRKKLLKRKSTNTSTTMSAFQRTSEAVMNAVKHLPFAAVVSTSSSSKQSKTKKSIFPRSLSRKLLTKSFWMRTDKEIERRKSFKYLLKDKEKSSVSFSSAATNAATSVATATTTDNSSMSENNSGSNSWSDSNFTSDYLPCSSVCSESSCDNDVVAGKRSLPKKVVSNRVAVAAGDDSIEATTTTNNDSKFEQNKWPNQGEKEQCSPVSVLDFPFDDEEKVSSPFQRRLASTEGTKQKLVQKIQRFEDLADQLEPVDLENPFSLSEFTEEPPDSTQDNIMFMLDLEEEENDSEHKAVDLLVLMKSTTIPSSSFKFKVGDNLLLDFFIEKISEAHSGTKTGRGDDKFDYELLNEAKDWMKGSPHEMLLEWEVQKNRQAYIREIEKGGRWSKLDEHKEEVAVALEVEVFASLVKELLLDLFS